jgi:hypothetical protein
MSSGSKTMKDVSADNAGNLEARVTEVGKAIGERVQNATAATAAAAGQAQKMVQDATAATAAAVGQANKVLGDASETAQQAWSRAGGVAQDVVDAGRCATRSVSRQIHENPLLVVLVGFALGYVARLWVHGGGRPGGGPRSMTARPVTGKIRVVDKPGAPQNAAASK